MNRRHSRLPVGMLFLLSYLTFFIFLLLNETPSLPTSRRDALPTQISERFYPHIINELSKFSFQFTINCSQLKNHIKFNRKEKSKIIAFSQFCKIYFNFLPYILKLLTFLLIYIFK